MEIKSYLDIIQALSVVVTSIIAIWGISSWRLETKWKRRYELAEDVLSCFYETPSPHSLLSWLAGLPRDFAAVG